MKLEINNDIKYFIVEHVNFENITQIYNIETSNNKIFNDDNYTRHDIISILYNICQINYYSYKDRNKLDTYIFDIYSIDINSQQINNQKRYIN